MEAFKRIIHSNDIHNTEYRSAILACHGMSIIIRAIAQSLFAEVISEPWFTYPNPTSTCIYIPETRMAYTSADHLP